MKKLLILLIILFTGLKTYSQEQPKLVVGIVVDQMRYDYLARFWDKYGEDGFKKLVTKGANCTNAHFNYMPTYTGPGHASIYTGTTPANHGIIANDWFDKQQKNSLNFCSLYWGIKLVKRLMHIGLVCKSMLWKESIYKFPSIFRTIVIWHECFFF